jgi:hypothetical protein
MPLSIPKEPPVPLELRFSTCEAKDKSFLKASIPGFWYVAKNVLVSAIAAFPIARARESAKERENRRAIIKKIKGTK